MDICYSYFTENIKNSRQNVSAFIAKVHSYFGFKLYVKNTIINQYLDHCTLQYCNTCDLLAQRRLQSRL